MALSALGVAAVAVGGLVLLRLTTAFLQDVRTPGVLAVCGSAAVLLAASVLASMLPALRAARVDIIQALRSD
jgi:ABC-type antimicrobial peptide transport system permease subunit